MRPEHFDRLRHVDTPSTLRVFVEAVLALSEDPAPSNVERYLLASRALDDSRLASMPESARGERLVAQRQRNQK